MPAGVGLALDGLPVVPVPQRGRLIVSHDADVKQLGEDGPLGAEDRVYGLDGHVGCLGDGGHGCGGIAIAKEERFGGVEHAVPGGQGFALSPAGACLDWLIHIRRVSL